MVQFFKVKEYIKCNRGTTFIGNLSFLRLTLVVDASGGRWMGEDCDAITSPKK